MPSALSAIVQRCLRPLAYRLMQFFGNLLKLMFYLHFRLWPQARFTLPARSAAWRPSRGEQRISRIVWQTNYSDSVTLPVYFNYLWNRLMSAGFEYRFCNDEVCAEFVRREFPGAVFDAYSTLQIGAAKADFWRVLVLLRQGGVYLDIDAAFCWPLGSLFSATQTELFIRTNDQSLTNFFMASAPNQPLMQEIADRILRNVQENKLVSVYDMTGPTVLDFLASREGVTIESYRGVCRQGQFTSKHFQYPDKLRGYWVKEQEEKSIVKSASE